MKRTPRRRQLPQSPIAQRLTTIETRLAAIERKLDERPPHGPRRRHRRVIPS